MAFQKTKMNIHHFSGQTGHHGFSKDRRSDSIEDSLNRAERSAAKFRAKYRNIKKFLLAKGVPQQYFDEYNAQFNAEYEAESIV